MSKILQKIIVLFTVFIIIFNAGIPLISHAEEIDIEEQFDEAGTENLWLEVGGDIVDGIVGVLTWIPRASTAAIGLAVQTIVTQLCGFSEAGVVLTAEDIIFTGSSRESQINILNINFFDFSGNGAEESLVKSFRENVAKWYFTLRTIAIILSLGVLIYIGIRMAISSIASDKAMYKKMLINWIVGFAILILLHYLILIILNLNNQLVDLMFSASPGESSTMKDYAAAVVAGVFSPSFVKGWGSLVIYILLMGTTIALFIMYMKRLFTVGFLIVISPLITVTYAIDKLGDGKSQALNTWLKEFSYNVLIQPFHCIIYMVFVSTAISTLSTHKSLGNLIFAVLSILFIFKAESIVKKIFGFDNASSVGEMAAAGAIAAGAVSKLTSGGKSKGSGSSGNSSKSAGIQRKQIPASGTKNANGKSSNTSASNNGSASSSTGTSNTGTSTSSGQSGASTSTGSSSSSAATNAYKSAFARALSDFKDEKAANAREFFADPKGALLNSAKQLPLKQLAATAKFMPKLVAGGLVAGATGDGLKGIGTGYAVTGGKFTRKVQALSEEDLSELKMQKQDKTLASSYERFRIANDHLSDDELYNKSADLLEADIETLTDRNEIDLAKQLQSMKSLYEARGYGEKDAEVRVMDRVENIQMGNVKNSVSVKLDKMENAVRDYKASKSSSVSNAEIENITRDFMSEIDKIKGNGEKYLKSEQYKALDKNEKELAKEIYKSKEVLEALGTDNSKAVNREIEAAIKKGLSNND